MSEQFCPTCKHSPCNCDWSEDEDYEEGAFDIVQVPSDECDGDSGINSLPSITDFGSSIFDCISGFSGYPRDNQGRERNTNIVGPLPLFEVGDLVRWYPVHQINKSAQVWIIKKILNPSLMESGWFDYEITNGSEIHHVTKYELFKLRTDRDG